jgi:putative ABC transport system permease protein
MITLALKMLIGNKASFIGVIFGIFLATLLISQQSAIFLGLVSRSYRTVTDIPTPDVWVMDPATESIDRVRSMPANYLDLVRSTIGIEWAAPLNLRNMPLVTQAGLYEVCELYGIDDAMLIGAPMNMLEGDVRDIRRQGGVIIDIYSAKGSLATKLPDGTVVPLKIGDELEISDTRAVVVGICKITQGFYPQPILFTSNSNFYRFAPGSEDRISFIAAKTLPGADVDKVCSRINAFKQLDAMSTGQFKWRIVQFFLKTGILINFGLSVGLGLIIGFSIAGQIFYIMTLENLMYYALIKALGGSKRMILHMITVQALVVGVIGFIVGTAVTFLWGMATNETTLAFLFPWELLLFTGAIALLICIFTAGLSIRKVFTVDPKMLMGN